MTPGDTLLEAIRVGDADKAREILRQTPEAASVRDHSGVSAFMLALYHRRPEIAEEIRLLRGELDVWEASASGEKGRVLQILLGDPSAVNRYSPDGFTPLGFAAFFGHQEVLDLLVTSDADINAPSRNAMFVRPIHSATAHGAPEKALSMVRTLLRYGAEVNVAQGGGLTPLHQAAAQGDRELVRLLLQFGADRTVKSAAGKTPLDLAVEGNHAAAITLLQ